MWKNKPTNFGVQVLSDADELTKKIAGEMLQGVVVSSPVDSGAFRSNHKVSIGSVDTTADPNQTANNALQRGLGVINSGPLMGKVLYISNSLPYAERIENGWSQQTPFGVYSITFMNVVNKYK